MMWIGIFSFVCGLTRNPVSIGWLISTKISVAPSSTGFVRMIVRFSLIASSAAAAADGNLNILFCAVEFPLRLSDDINVGGLGHFHAQREIRLRIARKVHGHDKRPFVL